MEQMLNQVHWVQNINCLRPTGDSLVNEVKRSLSRPIEPQSRSRSLPRQFLVLRLGVSHIVALLSSGQCCFKFKFDSDSEAQAGGLPVVQVLVLSHWHRDIVALLSSGMCRGCFRVRPSLFRRRCGPAASSPYRDRRHSGYRPPPSRWPRCSTRCTSDCSGNLGPSAQWFQE